MFVLAIDQGTSGTKALVVGPDGVVAASATAPVRPVYGENGLVEVDPTELLASVLETGRAAIEAARVPVAAVGLANQGETVLAWNPTSGQPLSQAIVWQDGRAETVCARLREHAERLAELTGLPLDPYFAAPKLAWLREQGVTGGVVTTSDAWLVHRLTGELVTDAATASRTMLLDLDLVQWSPEAVGLFGLDGEELPRVVDCAGAFGETDAFGPRLPLTGLVVDQQAALIAQRCLAAGEAKCTYGTGCFLLANVGQRAVRSASGLATSVAWRLGGDRAYCVDGQVYTAGSAVRWLVDVGLLAGADELDVVAGGVADSAGVGVVPAFAGLGAPHWRSEARAAVSGLGLGTTAGHLVRATLEGIACEVAALAEAVAADAGDPLVALRVDGGLTGSTVLMQLQADVAQVPIEVFPSTDATALGVAALARVGLEGLGLDAAVPRWAAGRVFEPSIGADEAAERRARRALLVGQILERGQDAASGPVTPG